MRQYPAIEYLEQNGSRIFARVTRALLDQAADRPAGSHPLVIEESDWRAVWSALRTHRIETFLPPALDSGAVVIPGDAGQDVAVRAQRMAVRRLRLLAALHDVVEMLDADGLDVRVLKGLATGQLDHVREAHRRTSDVDILVRPHQFARACELIAATGAADLKAAEPTHLLVESTFRTPKGIALDLHHRLFRFGQANDDVLFQHPEPLPGGCGLALSREGRLVHAAGHLLFSPPGHRQMSSLFDVAVLAHSTKLDLDAALKLADRFGAIDVVLFAIWLNRNVGVNDPEPMPAFRKTLINRAHLRTNRRGDFETLAIVMDFETTRDRIAHLRFQSRRRRPGGRAKFAKNQEA